MEEILKRRIKEISELEENWDGYDATVPPQSVINNVRKFLDICQKENIKLPDADNVYPTPYGSIVIDFDLEDGLLSLEVGDVDMGFFTDFKRKQNVAYDHVSFDSETIPTVLQDYLK